MTQAGSRASQGEKAGSQPGQVGGVLLHETAVSGTNQKEAKNPKRTNLVFCTTDNTNSPPTDQSVDYSVLSPRTNEAPAIMDELRNGPRSGYKSRYKSSLALGGWGTVRASICTSQAKVQIKVQIVPAGGRLGYSASICISQAKVQVKVQIVPAGGRLGYKLQSLVQIKKKQKSKKDKPCVLHNRQHE